MRETACQVSIYCCICVYTCTSLLLAQLLFMVELYKNMTLCLCDGESWINLYCINPCAGLLSLWMFHRKIVNLWLQAIKSGAVYPKKLWVIYGMEGGAWWEWDLDTQTKCSNAEVKQFLDKAITIVPLFDGEVKGRKPTAANPKVYIMSCSFPGIWCMHVFVWCKISSVIYGWILY